jgi:hypothetical protein
MNTTAENSGSLIILIDESTTMNSNIGKSGGGENRKSKAECAATAINSFLNRLTNGPNIPVAIIGYRSDDDTAVVGSRWAGSLAGRDFVMTSELAESPVRVDERVRQAADFGAESTTVQFPIWYEPDLSGSAPQVAAFDCCSQLIEGQDTANGALVICHITASSSADGNPQKAVEKILEADAALVCNLFLSSHDEVPASEYKSNRQFLPPGNARSIFDRTSLLPDSLVRSLRQDGVAANDRARALVFNAQMLQLVQFLNLIQKHTDTWMSAVTEDAEAPAESLDEQPTADSTEESTGADADADDELLDDDLIMEEAPEADESSDSPTDDDSPVSAEDLPSVSPEQPAAVVLVIDRSLENPSASQMNNVCNRLCDEANELLEQITNEGRGSIDVGVVSYGAGEVCSTFEGPLADRSLVRDSELAQNPSHVEDIVEKIDDGTGGLLEFSKQKPIWVELEPSEPGSVVDAFACAADILDEWRQQNNDSFTPIVLHLTRGGTESSDVRDAATRLQESGAVTLYHLVKPELAHANVFFPTDSDGIDGEGLKALFDISSPLQGASQIAVENDTISPDARGIVINSKFTMLLQAISQAMVD